MTKLPYTKDLMNLLELLPNDEIEKIVKKANKANKTVASTLSFNEEYREIVKKSMKPFKRNRLKRYTLTERMRNS